MKDKITPPLHHSATPPTAIDAIRRERVRQIKTEGHSSAHDDKHTEGQLAQAATCYAHIACTLRVRELGNGDLDKQIEQIRDMYLSSYRPGWPKWPWFEDDFKPSPDPLRNIEKAGALLAAEYDRLTRLKAKSLTTNGGRSVGAFVKFEDRLMCIDRFSPEGQIVLEDALQIRGAFSVLLAVEEAHLLSPATTSQVRLAFQPTGIALTNGWANRCGVPIDHALRALKKARSCVVKYG